MPWPQGPDYQGALGDPRQSRPEGERHTCDAQLASAYKACMALAKERQIQRIGFPLLAGGACRGERSLAAVTRIAVDAIADSVYPELDQVHILAFEPQEQAVVKRCVQQKTREVEQGALKSGTSHDHRRESWCALPNGSAQLRQPRVWTQGV